MLFFLWKKVIFSKKKLISKIIFFLIKFWHQVILRILQFSFCDCDIL